MQQTSVLAPQVDPVIEVTGRKSNVTVTFDTQKENGEDGEPQNGTLKISDGKNDLSLLSCVVREKRQESLHTSCI